MKGLPTEPVYTGCVRAIQNGFLDRYFGLDRRSLALMRVVTAVAILCDLSVRAMHLSAHYGVGSIYPPAAFAANPSGGEWSFLGAVLSVAPGLPLAAFAIAFMGAILLLVGYRT